MPYYNLEDVFTTVGMPTITYVQPEEYVSLLVSLRTKGKCVVVEGPSGIGKTTAVQKVLSELDLSGRCKVLSARKKGDISKIEKIADGNFQDIAIIDDFHRLDASIQNKISDVMKYLADEADTTRKIVVIGINKVGDTLVHFSPDLNNRIATIHFESNPKEKIQELIRLGEEALNFRFDSTDALITHCLGSFHIAQLMCYKACELNRLLNTCQECINVHFDYPTVLDHLSEELGRSFFEIARTFATGNRIRREGRAPYLHILKWLSESTSWSISLTTEVRKHPEQKAGVTQIVEKGYLRDFLKKRSEIGNYIHYDDVSKMLSVEDPKFLFYLKTINWNNFAKDIGFIQLIEKSKYDFALSFAGSERPIAEALYSKLSAREIAVFYDKNEQADIFACNVENYLYSIYSSEAAYVIPLLSKNYPTRIWTRFESNAFKERFGRNAVIPVWFNDVDSSMFDESRKYGGWTYDVNSDMNSQLDDFVDELAKKIEEYRAG